MFLDAIPKLFATVKGRILQVAAAYAERLSEDVVVALAYLQRERRKAVDEYDRLEQALLNEAFELREKAATARQRVEDFLNNLDN